MNLTDPVELLNFSEVEFEDKGTSTKEIKTQNQSNITKQFSLVNEHPEIKLKPQLSDMLTSPDLVKVEVPSLTTS